MLELAEETFANRYGFATVAWPYRKGLSYQHGMD